MITSLSVKNFKAWEETGPIKLAPLTVLFGANSSGKSSLNQLLLLLKQTAESPDRRRVLHSGDRRSLVDVGTYQDMVFDHETSRSLTFALTWKLPSSLSIHDPRSDKDYSGDWIRFHSTIRQEETPRSTLVVDSMGYLLLGNDSNSTHFGLKSAEDSTEKYALESSNNYNAIRSKGRAWPLPPPVRFYGFPDEAVAYYENTGFLPDFALELERLLGRVYYLGPLRQRPERTYIWSGEVPEHVGWNGERAIEAILAARDRKINRGYKKKYYPFEQVVARWLRRLGLINSFQVQPIAEHRKEYEVNVQVSTKSPEVKLPEVGFGVSQVLPIVVQCFYARRDSIVILEQPEIHLHPSVQSTLADLFVEAIHAREGGEDRRLQLIVESHSEHFLRRLQRLIAEEAIRNDQVAVYFCRKSNGRARIDELELDLFGRIENWPENFFGDLTHELEEQTRAMLRRRKKQEGDAGGQE